jgi:hypothetical protein
MDSQNERSPAEEPQPAESPPKRRRFQIVKLEERIAPNKGGVTNKGHGCGGPGGGATSSGTTSGSSGTSIY